jgi:uncharacterized protein
LTEADAAARPGAAAVFWRLLSFFGLVLILGALASMPVLIFSPGAKSPGESSLLNGIPGLYAVLIAIVAATYLMLRVTPGLSWSALGLDASALAANKLLTGLLVGAVAIGVPSAVLLLSGELRVQSGAPGVWANAAAFDLFFLLPAAAVEELMIRGYVFALIRARWGWKAALAATSLIFGLLHVFNPGAGPISLISVVLAGIFLGGILLVTRSLYAAIAAHLAWNWTMAAALHTAVSGAALPAPNYRITDNGPDWLTGGVWGPEGGAAAVAGMAIIFTYLYRRQLRRMES